MSALIKFSQGLATPPAGQALIGVAGSSVTAQNQDSNGDNFKWTMIDVPPGSTVPTGVVQDGPSSSFSFTPDADVPGGYHLQLEVTKDGLTTRDRRVFQVPEFTPPGGWVIVPFHAEAPALNFGGQTRGWAKYMEELLRFLLQGSQTPGGADGDIQTNDGGTSFGFVGEFTSASGSGRIHATSSAHLDFGGDPGDDYPTDALIRLFVFNSEDPPIPVIFANIDGDADREILQVGVGPILGDLLIPLELRGSEMRFDVDGGTATLVGNLNASGSVTCDDANVAGHLDAQTTASFGGQIDYPAVVGSYGHTRAATFQAQSTNATEPATLATVPVISNNCRGRLHVVANAAYSGISDGVGAQDWVVPFKVVSGTLTLGTPVDMTNSNHVDSTTVLTFSVSSLNILIKGSANGDTGWAGQWQLTMARL